MPGHCDSIDELTVYNQKATEFYSCNYLLDYPYLVRYELLMTLPLLEIIRIIFTEGYTEVHLIQQNIKSICVQNIC